MIGYQVVVDALREAGRAAENAGAQASAVDLAGALSGVVGALPGSRSAQGAAAAANVWREQMTKWSADAKKLGQDMASSADRYAASEDTAADLFSAHRGGMRPL